ncbi:MAG: hypothetical protein JXQ84_09440 [Rhodospirillaceae bacterium]|nr:hypothetical protein [Rhodospirillaceae bacterium]
MPKSPLAARRSVFLAKLKHVAKSAYARHLDARNCGTKEYRSQRKAVEEKIASIPRENKTEETTGAILIDGSFDNPNYWYRLGLCLAASGFPPSNRIGIIGPYRKGACSATLRTLGVAKIVDFSSPKKCSFVLLARKLLRQCQIPSDILKLKLPDNYPAASLYDQILKRQRTACVRLDDAMLETYVVETLAAISEANNLLSIHTPSLILLSHAITPLGSSLAWAAQRQGIDTIVLFGNYGTPRFWRIHDSESYFNSVDRPSGTDIDALTEGQANALLKIGTTYLEKRLSGQTNDIATQYAFAKGEHLDRSDLAQRFGWNDDKPIISVYASNWFDFPHSVGMTQFTDFLDWINVTKASAIANTNVYWLFRSHPVDNWYGGLTLKDVLPDKIAHHVRLCPSNWSGSAVTEIADGLITYHGTAAVEYAALGKPALVADRGWYHDCGFVVWPQTRADYIAALARPWWQDLDMETAQQRARIFAGWYFCVPEWQKDMVLPDDSHQGDLYQTLLAYLTKKPDIIAREVAEIHQWLKSETSFYHTYKMQNTNSYGLSNIA